jgi:DinB superfamily
LSTYCRSARVRPSGPKASTTLSRRLTKVNARTYNFLVTYVETIEPRLTPPRAVRPGTAAEVLVAWCRDLEQELVARLRLVSAADLRWQPHPDSNSVAVTAWHVGRWLDVLGTRAFTGRPAAADLWHLDGWREATAYEPDGLGYLGLGTLTGYTPAEMRAVPVLDAPDLIRYLSRGTDALVDRIGELGGSVTGGPRAERSPYTTIATTLQGSFGHVGEIDALVALRARTAR